MATAFVSPNLFQLSGNGLHVAYATSGVDGKPHLHYQDNELNLNFSGSELRTIEFDLGTVVTARIQAKTDVGSTSFSVLIPRVNLNSGETGHVRTEGITTIHRLSIVPALNHGQLDYYTVTALYGTAQHVAF